MKVIVLSSGGLDSTTCISYAVDKYKKENVKTISFYYGQKLDKELECARSIAQYYELEHFEFDLADIFKYSYCSLLKHSNKDVEEGTYEDQYNENEIITSYVPFRNGLMLAVATTLAQSLYPDEEVIVMLGNHKDDFAYSDCSEAFTNKMSNAILEGTYNKVSLQSPLVEMTKAQIVELGLKLKTPYELTWSCYKGRNHACGKCASCLCRLEAFKKNNTKDFIEYGGNYNE